MSLGRKMHRRKAVKRVVVPATQVIVMIGLVLGLTGAVAGIIELCGGAPFLETVTLIYTMLGVIGAMVGIIAAVVLFIVGVSWVWITVGNVVRSWFE